MTFQLYPKTLLSLSPTCMHVPTSVTLGIAEEFATVCVLSLLLCCGAGCCCENQPYSPQGGDEKDFTKGYEVIVGLDPIILKVRALPSPLPERHWLAQLVIYRKVAVELSSPNIVILDTHKLSV